MKIELKRFSHSPRLSQETIAFAADVWVDGKRVGHAENAGHGGNTLVHLDPSVRDAVEAHGKKLVPAEYKFVSGTEWIVDQLVEALLRQKEEKRFAKIDAKEKAKSEQQGLKSARFRHRDTWLWFSFLPDTDPKETAAAIAARRKGAVDELVVLS